VATWQFSFDKEARIYNFKRRSGTLTMEKGEVVCSAWMTLTAASIDNKRSVVDMAGRSVFIVWIVDEYMYCM
jgi:hypothetical protein